MNETELANAAVQIREAYEKGNEIGRKILTDTIELGNILLEVKGSMSHAEFLPWCMSNLDFRFYKAVRYMNTAKKYKNKELPEGLELLKEVLELTEPMRKNETIDKLVKQY